MFINDFFNTNVTESKQAVSDYDTWSDQVAAQGGEVHPQKDRVRMVAQSWSGDTIGEFDLKTNQGWINDQQGVEEGAEDLDRQALDIADKLITDKNLAKLNDMAHDSTIYRALERYFAKNNISTTIFNRVAAIVFKKLDKYGRRLSTDPRIPEQGVAEGSDDFEVRLDGKTVPGPFNDFDHARNKASKLISYQKGEVAEVYVNGKLKMRLKLNTPHQHFDEHTAA